jgi:prepilin-type N-terminal cleavage/methylation domain-containing protein
MRRKTRSAFTLVELLVVIGIIAVLIGILLPVMSRVQARGRDLKCQANLRSLGQAFFTYVAEHKGSAPFGWYYNISNPINWDNAGPNERLTTVFSVLSRYASKAYGGDDLFLASGSVNTEDVQKNHSPYLRCAEAELVLPHVCSYLGLSTIFITPLYEARFPVAGSPNGFFLTKPATNKQLTPDAILFFDTAVVPGMKEDIGWVISIDVDERRLYSGAANPQIRFLMSPNHPIYRTTYQQGRFHPNQPVVNGGGWRNIDPAPNDVSGFHISSPYVGNFRFRHNRDTAMQAVMADGSVKIFNYNPRNNTHEVQRKNILIKPPAGIPQGNNLPRG